MSEPLFLERRVEEVILSDGDAREPRTWPLAELLTLGRFILLGDPGMGKTKALAWLAEQASSLKPIHASSLSSRPALELRRNGWLLVDALDEAQADPVQASALNSALALVDKAGQRWGISCRLADIHRADLQRFHQRAEDGGQAAPVVVRLLPLSPKQIQQFLVDQGVTDTDKWLEQVERLGWHDVASNPQSLIFLLKATQADQWPETRSQVFEMACSRLVKEHNTSHLRFSKFAAALLLHAAGWVCAMLLLCGKRRIADISGNQEDAPDALTVREVEQWLPASILLEHINHALKTRLFQDGGPVHRTVAEYLAAQSIDRLVREAGSGSLLAHRLEPIFMAGRTHLRTDLRGLAGWLGSLHRDFQPLIQRDPEAALLYGDLARLSDWDKQFLIASLAHTPTDSIPWQAAQQNQSALVPLVSGDELQRYVRDGFQRFSQKPQAEVRAAEVRAALVLLQGLHAAKPNAGWEPCLVHLIRHLDWNSALREMAFEALQQHAPDLKVALLPIWSDLGKHKVKDSDGRLFPALVEALYPASISFEDVFSCPARWMAHHEGERLSYTVGSRFWEQGFLDKIERAEQLGKACAIVLQSAPVSEDASPEQFRDALTPTFRRLLVRFVLVHGEVAPAQQLAQCWQRLMPYGSLERDEFADDPDLVVALTDWQERHLPIMRAAMLERLLLNEEHPHLANCFLRQEHRPDGHQYLLWTETLIQWGKPSLAAYCLREAYVLAQWSEPVDRELMESAFSLGARYASLHTALEQMTVQTLDAKDPTVRHHQYLRRDSERSREARKEEASYLLERLRNLERISNGEDLHFLGLFAWTRIGGTYIHDHKHKLVHTWLTEHPSLEHAAYQGAEALLTRLEPDTWKTLFQKRTQGMQLRMELPVMLAAQHLHQSDTSAMAQLEPHQVLGLWACRVLGFSHPDAWFNSLLAHHINTIAPHWRQLLSHPPKGCADHALSSLDLLARVEPQSLGGAILEPLLEELFSRLPASKIEAWLKFIRASLPVCNPDLLAKHLERLMVRHASDPSVHSLVLVAALGLDPAHFAPNLQSLPRTVASSKALMTAWHRLSDLVPLDHLSQMSLVHLFDMAARIARPEIHSGFRPHRPEETAENLCRGILNKWSLDPSEEASACLSQLVQKHGTSPWCGVIQHYRVTQLRVQGEHSVRMPKPQSVARLLSNQGPTNTFDLSTLVLEALAKLQLDIKDTPFDIRAQFWNGQTPKLENDCRNVIGPKLKALLPPHIDCSPEAQHSDANRCDLQLSAHVDGQNLMLPIEVKMDWHPALWTAPMTQLRDRYMGDRRCHHMGQPQGIYLVLWVGAQRGGKTPLKRHPNVPAPTTGAELLSQLETEIQRHENTQGLKVFVLDISAPR